MNELPAYAAAVLDLVDQVPSGAVVTYGDIAEMIGSGGPRQVGQVMAVYGGLVAWHRVVMASGAVAPGHEAEAIALLTAEGVRMRGTRVDLSTARWAGPV